MKMKRNGKRRFKSGLLCLLTAALLLSAFSAPSRVLASRSEIEGQIDETEDLIEGLEDKISSIYEREYELAMRLRELELQENAAMAQKELLDERIQLTLDAIESVKAEIGAYELLIIAQEQQAADLKQEAEDRYERFCHRIRAMEENGSVTYYSILFGAASFGDLLSRIDFITEIINSDEKAYLELRASQAAAETALEDLKAFKERQEGVMVELGELSVQLDERLAESRALIASIQEDSEEYNQLYLACLNEEELVQNEINAAQAELEKLYDQLNPSAYGTGLFIWPLDSHRVTSPFGMRWHPIYQYYRIHNGIDIGRTYTGASIYAADNGTVITSKWNDSYGYYVVIDHANGYTTLYAHMSKLLVNVGDVVAQGDVIGLVGSTGVSTGPHLHFEVAYKGERTNPLDYFDPSTYTTSF